MGGSCAEEAVNCKIQPGHYYDKLLNKCIACKDICGTHPPECNVQCQTEFTVGPSTLKDSDLIIYSVLAVCLALLLSSLFLALVAFLRGGKAKTSTPGSTQGNKSKKKSEGRPVKETVFPAKQLGKISKDLLTSPSCSVNLEPSDDSLPTETCVCVHCFPDMNMRGQATSRPLRDSSLFYQQAVLQRAQNQYGGPCWTEPSFQTYGMKVQEEAAVG
ncbi:tumor necrosis factor receptor superfamily member 13B isoform X2 [Archocentrus centrarchus]|uniref:tumor necrosis factor receptor superfamily member 13B isoform X2 n=1 Tax=Archocentrus centrarchus TaxID=63155 RepID=UPI0011E9FF34|nr:tumor necrosis factor receptor superfamily member 13B isoform X2 [Archocentrus centrarchus]